MKPHDFFANKMYIRRPVAIEKRHIIGIAECRNIIGQRVYPNIDDVTGVKRHMNAPVKRGPCDCNIIKTGLQEVIHHFVGTGNRQHDVAFKEKLRQPVLILRQPEKIALLFCVFEITPAIGTMVVSDLTGCPKCFTRRAIETFVTSLIYVSLIVEFLNDRLDGFHVVFIRRSDEAVILNVQQFPQRFDINCHRVDKSLRCGTGFLSLALDFLTVFIHACQKENINSPHSLVTGHCVRRNGRIGVTNMKLAAGIINGCCNIVRFFRHKNPPAPLSATITLSHRRLNTGSHSSEYSSTAYCPLFSSCLTISSRNSRVS